MRRTRHAIATWMGQRLAAPTPVGANNRKNSTGASAPAVSTSLHERENGEVTETVFPVRVPLLSAFEAWRGGRFVSEMPDDGSVFAVPIEHAVDRMGPSLPCLQ